MARRSSWEQFADNFTRFHDMGNKLQMGIENRKTMEEEVEVSGLTRGMGPGGPNQNDMRYSYGGKTYDKEITPEMLTGLRNQRLINTMAKFGDSKGAMELQQKQATIDASNAATAAQQQQNELFAKTFKERQDSFGLANQQTKSQIGLSDAQAERILATYPVEVRKAKAVALGLEWDNKYSKETFDFRVDEAESTSKSAGSDAEIRAIEENEMRLTSNSRVASANSTFETNVDDNNTTKLENKVKRNAAETKILVNDAMVNFRNKAAKAPHLGGFKDDEAARDFLIDSMGKIDIGLADDLKENYNTAEITNLSNQSLILKKRALDAFAQGGIDKLSQTIDDTNGVNNTKVVTDGDYMSIHEYDTDGNFVRIIAEGNSPEEFNKNLMVSLDPATMMETSKAYMDLAKSDADTQYTLAMAEKATQEGISSKNARKKYTKEDWAVELLMKNPDDPIGLAALLGMEMSPEEINIMVADRKVTENLAAEEKLINAEKLAKINTPGGTEKLNDKDGIVETEVVAKTGDLTAELARANELITQARFPANSEVMVEARKLLESVSSPGNINAELIAIDKALEEAKALPERVRNKQKTIKDLTARKTEFTKLLSGLSGG